MLAFLNEEFDKAEQELTLAFYHCHNGAYKNKEYAFVPFWSFLCLVL
jgi:hypothetical protein